MRNRQQIGMISGGRLHLHDGPIDLVIWADGASGDVKEAYRAAANRFETILDELCEELAALRAPAEPGKSRLTSKVARRMERAVAPFAGEMFITPMAAVAGAVAEEILGAMVNAAPLARAYVNNGGDIALHLQIGEAFTIGLIADPGPPHPIPLPRREEGTPSQRARPAPSPLSGEGPQEAPRLFVKTVLTANDRIFGIATSGWSGRSFSLGIADAVTVLAGGAAQADAAATVIANAIDLPGHLGIVRKPACDLQPETDLGSRLVTCEVGTLTEAEIEFALERGASRASNLMQRTLIRGAALHLQGVTKIAEADLVLAGQPTQTLVARRLGSLEIVEEASAQ
jgi:uncharacterized protein